ncbi:polysaccharide deacetylase [Kordiimonas sediminis]|uniref:Chitooligosaccharide deacetylase n=1 Tax=Kordiimonas sediminis TaxID=1735581 RepID=A0A919ANS7_9PROT|nr:polysaccharide deacetylase family protein [Kordiimonas sediminis]GHF16211.1 polysaccharide deacetylase [Kordiimonas sediminis]
MQTERHFSSLRTLVIMGLLFCASLMGASKPLSADPSAVILMYHRFGENDYPSTNIQLDQFRNHIAELKKDKYQFLPLREIVRRLKNHEDLPSHTIAITVDDAYKSFQTHGWPILKEAGIPVTLFVSTGAVDAGHPNYLSWDDIRTLQNEGVQIEHHGKDHLHMVHAGTNKAAIDIKAASDRFQAEIGRVPTLFAYPYGEYSQDIASLVADMGFEGAFAQFSSVASFSSQTFALPRFPINERYGDMDRLRLIANSQALPVSDITPANPVLTETTNPPLFGFTVDVPVEGLKNLACYPSHLGKRADIVSLNGGNRIEVRFEKPFPAGRSRINCTLPGKNGRWYWLGQYFLVTGGALD